MARYLLSTHMVEGEARPPMSDDEMERLMARIGALEAEDLDAALAWGSKTAECITRPIEVRPFMHTDGA